MKIKHTLYLLPVFLLAAGFLFAQETDVQEPSRLKREDCFLGIHFDFHATHDCKNIGQDVTEEMVDTIIDMVGPDFIQVDTKGHPGVASFQTRFSNRSEHITADQLRVWRKVTKRRGVALYGHYSGLIDHEAGIQHPQWQAMNSDGGYAAGTMSAAGPYADELLIPQVIELGKEYGLDGIWVDGDCWGLTRDWTPSIQEEFTRATGIETVPTEPSDPNWHAWSQFHRELYRRYLRHCAASVKEAVPGFAYCGNWAYSYMMPEPPCDEVDFLSGDYSDAAGTGPVDVVRFLSRFFAGQGRPWDLMGWGFLPGNPSLQYKGAVQLQREAACVISQGGGFQAYYPQKKDGSVNVDLLRPYAEAADFCRQRQKFAFRGEVVPQAAVVLSTDVSYIRWDRNNLRPFAGDASLGTSICRTLLDHQIPTSILTTQKLMDQMESFPLVVVYQWEALEPELLERMTQYVRGGGNLLLSGTPMKPLFGDLIAAAGEGQKISDGVTLFNLGSGRFAVIDIDYAPDEVILSAVDALFTDRLATVEGNPYVDLTLTRTADGLLAIHLINITPPEDNARFYDSIEPVGPVELRVRLASAPKAVTVQPEGTTPATSYSDGILTVTVASVPIYEIVVIEQADE